MKILFIGGTGVISSACSQLAIDMDIDLTLLTRGQSVRPIPEGARIIQADIRDLEQTRSALAAESFDVVVDWIAYQPEHIQVDLELFRGRTGQYIFISSASVYQTPPTSLPVRESTLLDNPVWAYSRAKISCEEHLVAAYRENKFPMTIVRPSHTYDQTMFPVRGGYTVVDRMRRGKPVVVHGDGTSLWVLTHQRDFAKGFVGLLGHSGAIGQSVHITSDELLNWNQIVELLSRAAGCQAEVVHLPSDLIAAYDPEWGDSLLGDKAFSMIFDNSKIKRLVPDFVASIPFARGAQEILDWHDADAARQVIDHDFDKSLDRMISAYQSAWPEE